LFNLFLHFLLVHQPELHWSPQSQSEFVPKFLHQQFPKLHVSALQHFVLPQPTVHLHLLELQECAPLQPWPLLSFAVHLLPLHHPELHWSFQSQGELFAKDLHQQFPKLHVSALQHLVLPQLTVHLHLFELQECAPLQLWPLFNLFLHFLPSHHPELH